MIKLPFALICLYLLLGVLSSCNGKVLLNTAVNAMRMRNFAAFTCDKEYYPVTFSDVNVDIDNSGLYATGTVSTDIDLEGPIKAWMLLERRIWGVWYKVPCSSNIGTCFYPDLCKFGYPDDESCPNSFIQNNIPCRCPIPKGTYTINPGTVKLTSNTAIYSGQYWGSIHVATQDNTKLGCMNFRFQLYDGLANDTAEAIKDINDNDITHDGEYVMVKLV